MSIGHEAIRGALPRTRTGVVDFRLARNAIVSEVKRGRMSATDVCDAQSELLRAAKEVGTPTSETCPICEEHDLVHVSYVFGSRLPAHGRCITSAGELAKLARRPTELACYVVEVCPDCRWNHLARTFAVGGRPAPGC